MDHSQHPRLDPAELNGANLDGIKVYDRNDDTVGTISHVHGIGQNAQAIIDVGGFLGIGAKPVALSLAQLDVMRDEVGAIHAVTQLTRDEVETLPEHHH
ncbi:PRC-barrel domain-containing protein [Pseudorhodobacter ferrugineus]|uniref:PRC-barrel domain-containing protein n=1 Tax=Pseudorhodobacter ferrugineus TaxID=77008 RepID=UPI0003B385E6|nr:PRC-barrel domain-containing protein [Pseudorhodobacter ferrugineus]